MALGEVNAQLCAAGMPFEMDTVTIRGVPTRVWKNAPASLAALAAVGRSHGAATFLVYEDERVTFDAWHRAVAALAAQLLARGGGQG